MANGLSSLDALAGTLRCAACGAAHLRQDLGVVGERDGYVLVRCVCRRCGAESVAVVMVAGLRAPPPGGSRGRALTEDDVLAAHEILREHHGSVEALFAREDRRLR